MTERLEGPSRDRDVRQQIRTSAISVHTNMDREFDGFRDFQYNASGSALK